MPFKSEKQRKWMHANEPEIADKWEKKKKNEAERDYKAEYKKFQSSPKMKKYRAELNKYNRKKGTYGNGDGKDASHKGGKIVGFEAQSKNRGRAEKSRLKKEQSVTELVPNMAVINQPAYKKMLDRQISKNTKIKTALNNKDHKDHKKAKGIIQRLKDKLMKRDNVEEKLNLFLEKNKPTNPSKWDYYKAQAKKKFDVYPSAYANAWAAKQYKAAGGSWKKESVELEEAQLNESTYVKGKMLVILKNSLNQVHTSLVRNVTLSDSMDDNTKARLTMFKRRMDKARENYVKEVMRATKPFDKELTGV